MSECPSLDLRYLYKKTPFLRGLLSHKVNQSPRKGANIIFKKSNQNKKKVSIFLL